MSDSHAHARPAIPTAEQLADLPRDGRPNWNRLVFEQSPYLLQHAANPVDWYPWGEEAFARARELDKPVFLSVGYATCHWCHVMERETFENPELAAMLNEAFVCVKVDREERPDIDHIYMTVTQALTGSGGWPMTVVMTADRRPFFAGTYFPPDSRFGRPGVPDLVRHLTAIWRDDRSRATGAGEAIATELVKMTASFPGTDPSPAMMEENFRALEERFEPRHGGFGQRPKFPVPHNLSFLLRFHQRTGERKALAMVEQTLRAMRLGGVFDHVGLGMHRYSTDIQWLVPHFEKMLYDQALTMIATVEAWQVTGNGFHLQTAEEIATYVLRDMADVDGGFYSAEDADSEGHEGKFHTWSVEEVHRVLGAEDGALFCEIYGFEERGNFREESTGDLMGVNIPHLKRTLEEEADARGEEPDTFIARIEAARAKLFAVRARRVHPLKDDKVLTDWNGLMIAALARAGRAMEVDVYTTAARHAADFCLTNLRREDGRLLKRWRGGVAGLPAHLEDYAFLAWGLVELYEATFEPRWLLAAGELLDVLIARFFDEKDGGFFQTADDGEALIVRSKDVYDGALPSGNSVAALALTKYSRMLGDERTGDYAARTLRAFSGAVMRAPGNFSMYLQGAYLAMGPSCEIVLAGDTGDPGFAAMARAARRAFLPNAVLVHRPADEDSALLRRSEKLRAQAPLDGRATAYICSNFACEQPLTDAATFAARIAQLAAPRA